MFLSEDQSEIVRKLRVLQLVEAIEQVAKTCQYFFGEVAAVSIRRSRTSEQPFRPGRTTTTPIARTPGPLADPDRIRRCPECNTWFGTPLARELRLKPDQQPRPQRPNQPSKSLSSWIILRATSSRSSCSSPRHLARPRERAKLIEGIAFVMPARFSPLK